MGHRDGDLPGHDSLLVDLALLSVVLMWASTFVLFKIAWRSVDPVAFTGIRFGSMMLLALAVLASSRDRVRLRRQDLPRVALGGISGYFLYQLMFVLGLDRTTALASSILVATHPIFSVLFVWLLGRERPARTEVLGVLLGFAGVAVFLRAWDAAAAAQPGDLLSLGAAAAFGAYGVINRSLTRRYPARDLMGYGLAVGGALITLTAVPAMLRQDWGAVRWPAWLILVYASIGPVYIAYGLWNWAIHRRGIPRTVVYGFLTPVAGGALAVLALNEVLRPEQVVGAMLVMAGLIVTRRPARRRAATAAGPVEPGPQGEAALRAATEAD